MWIGIKGTIQFTYFNGSVLQHRYESTWDEWPYSDVYDAHSTLLSKVLQDIRQNACQFFHQ